MHCLETARHAVQRWAAAILAAALALGAAPAADAADLSIQPIGIVLDAARATGVVKLSNQGSDSASFEATLFFWSQSADGEILTPADGWVVTPPIFTIEGGETQTLRVGRLQPAPVTAAEQALRLRVEELPSAAPSAEGGAEFRVIFLLPVFLPGSDPTGPLLSATLASGALAVANTGTAHAKLLAITQDSEASKDFTAVQSLSTYVLAGQGTQVQLSAEAVAALRAGARILYASGPYDELRLLELK